MSYNEYSVIRNFLITAADGKNYHTNHYNLEAMGAIITMNPDLTEEDIPGVIADKEILIVRSTKVTAMTIENGSSLSLIIRAGAGVNTIDLKTASRYGIHVANCPGKNSDAVAELAIGLLIAADRRISNATANLRKGEWNKKEYGKANGLKGRTLAVLGVGNIGKSLDALKDHEINIEEMQNSIFDGGEAATCTLKLDTKPSDELIAEFNQSSNIIKAALN